VIACPEYVPGPTFRAEFGRFAWIARVSRWPGRTAGCEPQPVKRCVVRAGVEYARRVARSPEDVFTGRLIGGELDGCVVEVDAGVETVEFGPFLVVFGSRPAAAEQLSRQQYQYRYIGVENTPEGRRALFEYVIS
jgi:hypothetical protein